MTNARDISIPPDAAFVVCAVAESSCIRSLRLTGFLLEEVLNS